MKKNREENCFTALEWRPEGKRRTGQPKTTQRRMVEDERQAAGWQSWMTVSQSLSQQTEVDGKTMSKPYMYVPYSMKRYRDRDCLHFWDKLGF